MLIGEVARRSGVSARMLRHYDTIGLVSPTGRTVGGYREYSPDDVRRIFHVECLRTLGLSLGQIGRALDDPTFTPSGLVGDLIAWTEARLARDRELLARLRVIDAASPAAWPDTLRIVDLLRGLGSTDPARRQQAALAPPEGASVPPHVLADAVLTESDPYVAGALRWALARTDGEAVQVLAEAARSSDVQVRRRAVLAVADLLDAPGAGGVLTDALSDPDATVRSRAALALGRQGLTVAEPTLVALVIDGTHDVEASEALRMLSGDRASEERIVAALADALDAPTADSPTRIRLAQALIEVGGAAADEVLGRLARDPDRVVALVASTFVTSRGAATDDDP